MKVRAMIRPNKVSEIRSIGSSTRPEGLSETSDIESNARWLNLQGRFCCLLATNECARDPQKSKYTDCLLS